MDYIYSVSITPPNLLPSKQRYKPSTIYIWMRYVPKGYANPLNPYPNPSSHWHGCTTLTTYPSNRTFWLYYWADIACGGNWIGWSLTLRTRLAKLPFSAFFYGPVVAAVASPADSAAKHVLATTPMADTRQIFHWGGGGVHRERGSLAIN